MTNVTCTRCGQSREGLDEAPYKGALGEEVRARICADCWQQWKAQELMVINEYRLRLFDRGDRARLDQACRQFLGLQEGEAPSIDYTPPPDPEG
jgi:Fe-S cluster biosynthesis and repair protein YggX